MPILHIFLHFMIPIPVAYFVYRESWKKTWLFLVLTMLVDLDHLLASPIYDSTRCSIGFHPLHQYLPIVCYALLLGWKRTRIPALGLLIHMALDSFDCWINIGKWYQ